MIKGAVFDMDGLIFDSERLVYEIWKDMLQKAGFEFNLEIFRQTIGLRTDSSEKFYKSVYGNEFDYDYFKANSRRTFLEIAEKDGVPIKKGLFLLLDFLRKNSIKTAVATSTSAETALKIIKKAGIYDFFDAFVCGNDVVKGKPDPEIFLTAAGRINVKPSKCVAYEDSFNGIRSAYSAGMITIMVPDLLEPNGDILTKVSLLCNSLDESIEFVKQNAG